MRQTLVATIMMTLVVGFVADSARTARNMTLSANGADLLDLGTLQQLGTPLVTTGGRVLSFLPHGAGVYIEDRRGRIQRVIFAPGAAFTDRGIAVTAAMIEQRAHLIVKGLAGGAIFRAYKITIDPRHHAIGGLLVPFGGGLVTITNRRGQTNVVKLLPSAVAALGGAPLRTGMRVVTLAVRDPRQPDVFLADHLRAVPERKTLHVGGVIRTIDPARHVITIYNKTQGQVDVIEIVSTTRVTLSKWDAGYADMTLGDHITVAGTTDPSAPLPALSHVIATHIRISSPSPAGIISAIAALPGGGEELTVRAHRNHVLRIEAPGRTPVLYGTQPAHVLNLAVGEKISVRGTRTDKFAWRAASIRIYPHTHTVGGVVARILPGLYRLVSSIDGSRIIVHVTSSTVFSLNGKKASASAVTVGAHVRISGYSALNGDEKGILTVVARHVSVIVRHHRARVHHVKTKKKATHKAASHHTPASMPAAATATPHA